MPGVFGVFYYRSARRRTLDMLAEFMPVPVDELITEFGGGASPETVCARTIRTLKAAGVRHFYISNLPLADTDAVLHRILDEAGG